MAIRKLEQVSCGLNLGYVYSLSYQYRPQEGSTITIGFINKTGVYAKNFLSATSPVAIRVGTTSFLMYPISYQLLNSSDGKVISVEFRDATFKLENYYITLKGNGCGQNIFSLGTPVKETTKVGGLKTKEEQDAEALFNYTSFPDLEYTFSDFLGVLRQIATVQSSVTSFATNSFTGTVKSVLDDWCDYLGFSYYMENGSIRIFDPRSAVIQFPPVPTDAISVTESESLEGTFGKTASIYARLEGGEVTYDKDESSQPDTPATPATPDIPKKPPGGDTEPDNKLITYLTFYPLYPNFMPFQQANPTQFPDIEQVVAAMYGEKFWFLYNYANGRYSSKGSSSLNSLKFYDKIGFYSAPTQSISWEASRKFSENLDKMSKALNIPPGSALRLGALDQDIASENFQSIRTYAENICGLYYQSDSLSDLGYYDSFEFDAGNQTGDGETFSFKKQAIEFEKFGSPRGSEFGVVNGTDEGGFPGIFTKGNRFIFKDTRFRPLSEQFKLTTEQEGEVNRIYNKIVGGLVGSENLNVASYIPSLPLDWNVYLESSEDVFFTILNELVKTKIDAQILYPRFPNAISFEGVKPAKPPATELPTQEPTPKEDGKTTPVTSSQVDIKQLNQDGEYKTFYGKYERCESLTSTPIQAMNHRFTFKDISSDVSSPVSVTPMFGGSLIRVERDLFGISRYFTSGLLNLLSVGQPVKRRSLSFSLNYFYNVGINPLGNGLTGLELNFGESGLTASYTFSNDALTIPVPDVQLQQIVQEIRNSIKRKTVVKNYRKL